jgi:titin
MSATRIRRLFASLSQPVGRQRKAPKVCRRLVLEALETRQVLSNIFTVTNVADSGAGSLRAAITAADALPANTPSTINFKITGGSGSGPYQFINTASALPQITNRATIDGSTQPGYAGSAIIIIDGASAGAGVDGLSYTAGASGTSTAPTKLNAVQVLQFTGNGVVSNGVSFLTLSGDYSGLARIGASFFIAGNGGDGVLIEGGSNHNTVTGCSIGTNTGTGITITGGATTTANTVSLSGIGTDAVVALNGAGNTSTGVVISGGAIKNTVRSSDIAGNGAGGVLITDAGTNSNTISGNHIGTDPSGLGAIANTGAGVLVQSGASSNIIGGTTFTAINIISGNTGDGVQVAGAGTTKTMIEGNFIGTDGTGTSAIANGGSGVDLNTGSSATTVGGTKAGSANVISGNTGNGVLINASNSNIIEGNFIGTVANGTAAIPNVMAGVLINGGSSSNTVGGTKTGTLNVISGNSVGGVVISDAGTMSNKVEGNFIGTDISGTVAIANGTEGVLVTHGATKNSIGASTAGARNVISGNTGDGVDIEGTGTSQNLVAGNLIGTNVTGGTTLANTGFGVAIGTSASKNTVGGTTAGARNVISANGGGGIDINSASSNVIEGNYIGTDVTGLLNLGNTGDGVKIENSARNNTVGGSSAGAANVISSNTANGVEIDTAGTTGNVIQGDKIGVGSDGTTSLGNANDGILLSGATGNTIKSCVIDDNTNWGIEGVSGSNHTNNTITGNTITGNGAGSTFFH